jgi:hypothetical protein
MRWKQIAATAAVLGAVWASGLAATALAAPARPTGFGMFSTWRAAQRAAKFKLVRPTKTDGLPRNGKIAVTRCEAQKKSRAHVVVAVYGLTPFKMLSVSQNNSGHACSTVGKVKSLGKVKVRGTTAQLTGKCGFDKLRPCSSSKIFLFLTWRKHGNYYFATSFGAPRKVLIGFAASLRPVT